MVALGAIPGLVPRSPLPKAPVVELAGGALMLVGAAIPAVAWFRNATAAESSTGESNG